MDSLYSSFRKEIENVFMYLLFLKNIFPSFFLTDVITEYTESGNRRILAYIPSWKNHPWLVRVWGCTPTTFHSVYPHVQSCIVRSN
jgi:hypothetical protein